MTKKPETLLGLADGPSAAGFSVADSVVPVSDDPIFFADQQRLQRHVDLQRMGSTGQQRKTLEGIDLISEIEQHVGYKFTETARELWQIRETVEGAEYQPYIDEFIHHLMGVSAQQMLGCAKIGATAIARIIAARPFPQSPAPEPVRLTWLGRLFVKPEDRR